MDGKLLERQETLGLEKMPTKLQLITTIARLIKQVCASCSSHRHLQCQQC